jgi:hypothetical protein
MELGAADNGYRTSDFRQSLGLPVPVLVSRSGYRFVSLPDSGKNPTFIANRTGNEEFRSLWTKGHGFCPCRPKVSLQLLMQIENQG